MTRPGPSRDDILGGRLAVERRATRVLSTVRARVSHMKAESRRAVEALFTGREVEFARSFGDDYLRALKLSATRAEAPSIDDLERFAPHWAALVPPEPETRAAVTLLLAERDGADPTVHPRVFANLGLQEGEAAAAFERLAGVPFAAYAFQARPSRPAAREPGDTDRAILGEAEAALEWLGVSAGTALIRAGDTPDFLYFVISGRFRVFAGTEADRRPVADVGRGELLGEIGVLTGERRTADVIAMRDSEVVRLPQDAVLRMAHESPRMLLRVNQVLARRLRTELSHEARRPSGQLTVTVVGSAPGTSIRPFAAGLARALARLGSVSHVTRERAEHEIPRLRTAEDPSRDPELVAWLSEQETTNRYVLFEADEAPSPWTDLCIRQADRIAIVADARGPHGIGDNERRIVDLNPGARRELVLVHPTGTTQPSGTAAWLRSREVATHHHVIVSEARLLERAARRIAGQAVGLVLGGGGVRGYAHVGAWRAIEELGMPVDVIGGTSVGAIMAAGMAGDRDADAMDDLGRVFARTRIMDFTLPMVSFFSSRGLAKLLREHSRGLHIEDLWRPFFCISTSLTRAEPVIHRTGPIWKAVRASSAIPGAFAPVVGPDGDLLVDGATMNNVPVDVMRDICENGPVIAVNLSPQEEEHEPYTFGPWVSGWRVLWTRLNPFAKPIRAPFILSTMLRLTEVGSVDRMRHSELLDMADLLINPPVQQYRRLDFKNFEALSRIGYDSARAALADWVKTERGAEIQPWLEHEGAR